MFRLVCIAHSSADPIAVIVTEMCAQHRRDLPRRKSVRGDGILWRRLRALGATLFATILSRAPRTSLRRRQTTAREPSSGDQLPGEARATDPRSSRPRT